MAKKKVDKERKEIRNAVEAFVHPKYPGLSVGKFGLAGGIVTGLCVLITTILAIYSGIGTAWGAALIDIYGFLGYNISWLGAILGAIYGFIDGFILTWVFALIYNKLLK